LQVGFRWVAGVYACNPLVSLSIIAEIKIIAMQTITFEQLPQAVSELHDKLNNIEQLLREGKLQAPEEDELLTILGASKFLNLSTQTVYGKVSRNEIPVNKQGKRLYFSRSELVEWIKSGRKKTISEIQEEAVQAVIPRKRMHR
jgi:excisionase family DNA binding protein